MALINDKPFQMRTSAAFLRRIDDWRRLQPDIPSRAEAIRRLIDQGLQDPPNLAVAVEPAVPQSPEAVFDFPSSFASGDWEALANIGSDVIGQLNVKLPMRLKKALDRLAERGKLRGLVELMLIEGVNRRLANRGIKPLSLL